MSLGLLQMGLSPFWIFSMALALVDGPRFSQTSSKNLTLPPFPDASGPFMLP